MLLLIIILCLLAYIQPIIQTSIKEGLNLFISIVFPALFLSILIINLYFALSNNKKNTLSTIFLAIIAGFPLGFYICSNSNNIKVKNVAAYANNPSPLFLINFAYRYCIESNISFITFLTIVYAPVILLISCSILCSKNNCIMKQDAARDIDLIEGITLAVNKTTNAIFNITIYILVFSIFSGIIKEYMTNLTILIIMPFFEITNALNTGFCYITSLNLRIIYSVFCIAIGGASTMFQSIALVKDMNIKKYIYQKLTQASLTVALAFILIYVLKF